MSNVPRPSSSVTDTVKARKESPLAQYSDKIGKTQVLEKEVKNNSSLKNFGTISHGFYCDTCKASFTSSDAYLDHCNGRVHQKNLGLSLKIERVDEVDRVKARLQQLTQKRQTAEQVIESKSAVLFERKLDEAQEENERIKEERKLKKKKKKIKKVKEESINEPEQNDENPELDMMSIMGFKSFT